MDTITSTPTPTPEGVECGTQVSRAARNLKVSAIAHMTYSKREGAHHDRRGGGISGEGTDIASRKGSSSTASGAEAAVSAVLGPPTTSYLMALRRPSRPQISSQSSNPLCDSSNRPRSIAGNRNDTKPVFAQSVESSSATTDMSGIECADTDNKNVTVASVLSEKADELESSTSSGTRPC